MNGSRMPTSVYSAAKAGVIAFAKAAALEHGDQGIRANAICPGFIETEMSGGKGAGKCFPGLVQGSAMKRAGQPEEVAELAATSISFSGSTVTLAMQSNLGGQIEWGVEFTSYPTSGTFEFSPTFEGTLTGALVFVPEPSPGLLAGVGFLYMLVFRRARGVPCRGAPTGSHWGPA